MKTLKGSHFEIEVKPEARVRNFPPFRYLLFYVSVLRLDYMNIEFASKLCACFIFLSGLLFLDSKLVECAI